MMRKIYLALVLLAFITLVIFSRHEFVCNMLGMCGNESIKTGQGMENTERTKGLTFSIDGDSILKDYDQFTFSNQSASGTFNDNNTAFLIEVLNYLNENPKTDLKVTGRYTSGEEETTIGIFETVGLARADLIREWFMVRNIESRRITITSAQGDDALTNPLIFEGIAPQAGVPKEYDDESVPRYTFEDMTYRFAYDSDKFIPNDAFKEYAERVKTFLATKENANKTVIIVGHTCDKGEEMYNYNLGKDRAENAKSYFVNKIGIAKDKVFSDSRGMSKPIVPNDDNEENRKQNRRVNIQIKD